MQHASGDPHGRHVFIVTTGLRLAGAERQAVLLAGALRDRGWAVRVVSLTTPLAHLEHLSDRGVRVLWPAQQGARAGLRLLLDVRRQIKETRPTVISFMYHSNLFARLALAFSNHRGHIASIRNERFGSRLREMVERFGERLSGSAVTTNSRRTAARLVERGVASLRIRVIPNALVYASGPDGAGSRGTVRSELGIADSEFFWLSIGRLHPQKNHEGLLEAFRYVRDEACGACVLRIVGEGPLRDHLDRIMQRWFAARDVQLLGARDDVSALLGAADALVLASAWEGLPNVVMEAMASGLPVVATDVGGVPELVENGRTGYVVAPGDAAALSTAMLDLMALGHDERRRMGDAASAAVHAVCAPRAVFDQWESLIDSVRAVNP